MFLSHHHWLNLVPKKDVNLSIILVTSTGIIFNPGNVIAQTHQVNHLVAKTQVQRLYVNPNLGNDQQGDGSQTRPYQTITQALQVAQPQTLITLASGTYSNQTGERFPLVIKNGITLQGNSRTRGGNIVISGGGRVGNSVVVGKSITIVMVEPSQLIGVTITNPNPFGYGVWIGASNPVIQDSTFVNNGKGGILVTGNSIPTIIGNYLFNNLGHGIAIEGNSQPQVQDNILDRNGFAINIADSANSLLKGNRLTGNRIGVVVEGSAKPVLRNNLIAASTEDGVVAISQSRPDLGTRNQPGGNIFRGNRRFDVYNSVASQAIPAFGNQFSGKVEGQLDWLGTTVTSRNATANTNQNSSASLTATTELPTRLVNTRNNSTQSNVSSVNSSQGEVSQRRFRRRQSDNPSQSLASEPQTSNRININVPLPNSNSQPSFPSTTTTPNNNHGERRLSDLLNVQPARVPNFNGYNSRRSFNNFPRQNYPSSPPNTTSIPNNPSTNSVTEYQVLVEVRNSRQESKLRELISGAFRTTYNGKPMIQVGRFSSQENAQEVVSNLVGKGFRAIIVPR